jgi:hypothetical protein
MTPEEQTLLKSLTTKMRHGEELNRNSSKSCVVFSVSKKIIVVLKWSIFPKHFPSTVASERLFQR